MYLVGGLYDVFQRGEPLLYSGLQNAAAGRNVDAPMPPGRAASGRFQLLFGPWTHGDIGTGVDLTALQLRWFDRWLKGVDNGVEKTTTPLHVIEPGGATYDTASYPVADAAIFDIEWVAVTAGAAAPADTYGEPVLGGEDFAGGIPLGDIYLKSATGQKAVVRTGV